MIRPQKKYIELPEIGLASPHLQIPLGTGNWTGLSEQNRDALLSRARSLVTNGNSKAVLALSRMLEPIPAAGPHDITGDNFVGALALVLVKDHYRHREPQRTVVAGDSPLALVLAALLTEQFHRPVILQSCAPSRHDQHLYHLLYSAGLPVSLGRFDPTAWEKGDIILVLEENYVLPAVKYGTGTRILLTPRSRGHAPALEQALLIQDVAPCLGNLAPLLELHLGDGVHPRPEQTAVMLDFEEKGKGLWDYFLDNNRGRSYNTLKGL